MKKARITNLLSNTSSPYLLQHANNPVEWYPWTADALSKARDSDLPILVSIGYSACHWCHVMERESFSDEVIAKFMNKHFINIKVDREENPALDDYLMEAVQTLNGNGGWPLNVFLTSDGRPFYGGTYFPPTSKHRLPSWSDVLKFIVDVYSNQRDKVERQADRLQDAVKNRHQRFLSEDLGSMSKEETTTFSEDIKVQLLANADRQFGGYSKAPKFLSPMTLLYTLRNFGPTDGLFQHSVFTIRSMQKGGIYDHVGGGIARYSTDTKWKVPHFEKMLYDNVQWLEILVTLYTKEPSSFTKHYLNQTFSFIQGELGSEDSPGFMTAIDADSEGEEGKFYIWYWDEWKKIKELLKVAPSVFDVVEEGNWEDGKNIIYWKEGSMSDSQLIENSEDWWDLLRDDIKILGVHRQSRIRPKTDYKYILSLNCLACWKLIESKSLVPGLFEDWDFSKHIAWVEQTFKIYDSSTNRVYSKGSGYGIAELTDYAYFCRALIAAHQYSQNVDYLKNAKTILDRILNDFTDEKDFYFNESKKDDQLSPGKTKQLFDQTMPSGNAVVCECLLILGKLLGLEGLVEKGEKMILGLKDSMVKFPLAFPYWVNVYQNHICNPIDIVIIGKQSKEVFDSLKGTHYLPNALYVSMDFENELIPLTIGKSKDSETYIYYCEGMSCSPPFKTVKDLNKWLR